MNEALLEAFRELHDLAEELASNRSIEGRLRSIKDLRELLENRRLCWRAFRR